MKTGDSLQSKSGFDATLGMGGIGPMPAQAAYIRPRRRFYTVRFTAPGGGGWREAFPFAPEKRNERTEP